MLWKIFYAGFVQICPGKRAYTGTDHWDSNHLELVYRDY